MNQPVRDHRDFPDATLKELAHVPGRRGVPILGMTPWLFRDFYGTLNRHHERYGLLSKMGIGLQQGVLALGPQNCQQVLLDQEKNFSSQMGYRESAGVWFGNAILSRDFDEHRLQRRVFQSAFNSCLLYCNAFSIIVANRGFVCKSTSSKSVSCTE